jgi:hypothetical protein
MTERERSQEAVKAAVQEERDRAKVCVNMCVCVCNA